MSPEDDAAGQLRRPTYAWRTVASADNYEIEVTDALGAYVSQEMGLVDTTWTPADTLKSLHTYDWRVRGRYGSEEGPWSSAWSFTTGSFVYDAPTLLAPEDSSVNQPVSLELAWQPIEGANGYRVQIGLNSQFIDLQVDSLVIDGGSSSDSAKALVSGLSIDTPYHWRVRVEDADGTSAWSESWQFRTIQGAPKRYYYVKDHLGSVRATVNEDGEVVHYDDFYPFGMQMPGRSHIAGTPTKENFTGHELDDETGLLYAGARYLDPVIGRFMATDRFAAKYPGLAPYGYAANNPLLYIDVNGDSLYVENRVNRSGFWGAVAGFFGFKRTDTYVYRDGNWFGTKTGSEASTLSGYLGDVSEAVSSLAGTAAGSKLVSAIANGSKDVTVVRGSANGFRGGISKGRVTWNPSLRESGLNTAGNTNRPPFVGLGHEIAHAYDAFGYDGRVGITPGDWGEVQTPDGRRMIGLSEMYASIVENMIRAQAVVPLRTHYALNKATNTGLLPIPVVYPAWFNF